jgi:hypothetical protein
LFTPTAAVFVEVGKSRTLRDSKLAADATAYIADTLYVDHFGLNLNVSSGIYVQLSAWISDERGERERERDKTLFCRQCSAIAQLGDRCLPSSPTLVPSLAQSLSPSLPTACSTQPWSAVCPFMDSMLHGYCFYSAFTRQLEPHFDSPSALKVEQTCQRYFLLTCSYSTELYFLEHRLFSVHFSCRARRRRLQAGNYSILFKSPPPPPPSPQKALRRNAVPEEKGTNSNRQRQRPKNISQGRI